MEALPMYVRDIMTADVIVASPDDDLMRAAQLMESNDFGSLPIGEDGRLIGMLTDRDITIRGVARGLGPDAKVREVMTTDVECVRDTDSVAEAAARMEDMQVRRLPVVDDDDKLVGIVSLGDLAQTEPDDAGDALQGISQPSSH
jgi:CBS domain-containing protein